jgi:aminotransferase
MGMDARVAAFEEAMAGHLGAEMVMVDSGSNALHAAVAALDLPPGSEVVVPSFTWVACANAVVLAGHRPVFADVDLATQNVTAAHCEAVIGPHTGAIMVVHYAGKPVDVEAVGALGLPVIEDAAHAVDSTLRGRACGTLGEVGIYSFDAVKNLATPDGGVVARRPELLDRVRRWRAGRSRRRRAAGATVRRRWSAHHPPPRPRARPGCASSHSFPDRAASPRRTSSGRGPASAGRRRAREPHR